MGLRRHAKFGVLLSVGLVAVSCGGSSDSAESGSSDFAESEPQDSALAEIIDESEQTATPQTAVPQTTIAQAPRFNPISLTDSDGWQYTFTPPDSLFADVAANKSVQNSPPGKAELAITITSAPLGGLRLDPATPGRTPPERGTVMGAAIFPTAGYIAGIDRYPSGDGCSLGTIDFVPASVNALAAYGYRCTTGFFSESLNLTKLADGDEAAMDDLKSQLEAVGDNYIIEIDLGICKAYFVNDQPDAILSDDC